MFKVIIDETCLCHIDFESNGTIGAISSFLLIIQYVFQVGLLRLSCKYDK